MFENTQGLLTVPQKLIELNQIGFQFISFLWFLLILVTQSFENRITEIDSITSHQQFLKFEVKGEVIFDVVV